MCTFGGESFTPVYQHHRALLSISFHERDRHLEKRTHVVERNVAFVVQSDRLILRNMVSMGRQRREGSRQ